jgi:hypothetical protein
VYRPALGKLFRIFSLVCESDYKCGRRWGQEVWFNRKRFLRVGTHSSCNYLRWIFSLYCLFKKCRLLFEHLKLERPENSTSQNGEEEKEDNYFSYVVALILKHVKEKLYYW